MTLFKRCKLNIMISLLASIALIDTSAAESNIGKQMADAARCLECHGHDGISSDLKIPNHAGQQAGYLIKQIRDFQSGARQHEIMQRMVEDLSEVEIVNIANFFATLKPQTSAESKTQPIAENLIQQGDPSRSLPACSGCHGLQSVGASQNQQFYPRLAGQRHHYLRNQLYAWKFAERTNSPDGVMNKIAKILSDAEIEALGDYLAELSP